MRLADIRKEACAGRAARQSLVCMSPCGGLIGISVRRPVCANGLRTAGVVRRLKQFGLLKAILKFASLFDQLFNFVKAVFLDQFVSLVGGEDPSVPEGSLDQGHKRGDDSDGVVSGVAARSQES